jgi:hypothetical protein
LALWSLHFLLWKLFVINLYLLLEIESVCGK